MKKKPKKIIDFAKIYEIQARKSKRKPVVEALVRRCKVSGLRFTKESFVLWLGDQMGYKRREGVQNGKSTNITAA